MRHLILFFFFSVSFFNGFAQSLEEEHNMFKYRNYRDMLTRKFLRVLDRSPQESVSWGLLTSMDSYVDHSAYFFCL